MPQLSNKLSQFWKEVKRRRILPFLIAYVAACFAIIEFFINSTKARRPNFQFQRSVKGNQYSFGNMRAFFDLEQISADFESTMRTGFAYEIY